MKTAISMAVFWLLGSSSAFAQVRTVMENVRSTKNVIFVATRTTPGLFASTDSYNGVVSNVGIFTTSNVVVSDTRADKCVIYATGSISCLGVTLSSGAAGSFVQKAGDTMTGHLSVKGSSATVYGAFEAKGAAAIPNIAGAATFSSSITVNAAGGFTGDVGVGTLNPGTTLDVNGSSQFGTGIDRSTFSTAGRLTLSNPGVINNFGGIYLNMDSDTGGVDQVVEISEGRSGFTGGTVLLRVQQDGAVLVLAGTLGIWSRTKAQLCAITPAATGRTYYCSNCIDPKIVVSTGTSACNFADAAGGIFK